MMGFPLVIIGCTATGKSELAEALAMQLTGPDGRPATIMAVDSMQVYRGMDIGTAKPSTAVRSLIPHVMIDVADPCESFSAARFTSLATPIMEEHRTHNRPLILVAGTILYLRVMLEGLFAGPPANVQIRAALTDQAEKHGSAELHKELARVDAVAAQRIHPNDLRRIIRALEVFQITGCGISTLQTQWQPDRPYLKYHVIGVVRTKEDLNRRINQRVRKMIEAGLAAEVQGLLQSPQGLSMQAREAVGYKQIIAHLTGVMTLDEAIEQIKIQTRHLAKLQRTWLKRFDAVTWLELQPEQAASELTGQILRSLALQQVPV